MLVHICCSVDSHYFLEEISKEFKDEKITCFFYDPNIHPYSEYKLRFLDVQRSCNILNIDLIEGDYNYKNWLKAINGFENEPEKGKRCNICFDNRLSETVKIAQELEENKFTTTLLISPLKSQEKLLEIGKKLQKDSGIEFIFRDFRSNGGVEKQSKAVKENRLYRQDYCGCIFALNNQRESQNILMDEMISPINRQILPASIEEKIEFYENLSKNSKIKKESFLNYRLLSGKVLIKKKAVPSYFLHYSHSEKIKISGRVENIINDIGYLNRNSVKIITISKLNNFLKTDFLNIFDIKLKIEDEVYIRKLIDKTNFSLSPIIILEDLPVGKIDIEINSKIYLDSKDVFY